MNVSKRDPDYRPLPSAAPSLPPKAHLPPEKAQNPPITLSHQSERLPALTTERVQDVVPPETPGWYTKGRLGNLSAKVEMKQSELENSPGRLRDVLMAQEGFIPAGVTHVRPPMPHEFDAFRDFASRTEEARGTIQTKGEGSAAYHQAGGKAPASAYYHPGSYQFDPSGFSIEPDESTFPKAPPPSMNFHDHPQPTPAKARYHASLNVPEYSARPSSTDFITATDGAMDGRQYYLKYGDRAFHFGPQPSPYPSHEVQPTPHGFHVTELIPSPMQVSLPTPPPPAQLPPQ